MVPICWNLPGKSSDRLLVSSTPNSVHRVNEVGISTSIEEYSHFAPSEGQLGDFALLAVNDDFKSTKGIKTYV